MPQPTHSDIQRNPCNTMLDSSLMLKVLFHPTHSPVPVVCCSFTKLAFPLGLRAGRSRCWLCYLDSRAIIISVEFLLKSVSKLTSEPISRARISFSISTTCCSSANANAHGTPKSSALVLITYSVLPLNSRPDFNHPVVASTVSEMYERAVGGMMSRSASNRSAIVSSTGVSSSSSEEISESARVSLCMRCCLRASYQYPCSSRPHPRLGRTAWSQRTHPRLRLIQP